MHLERQNDTRDFDVLKMHHPPPGIAPIRGERVRNAPVEDGVGEEGKVNARKRLKTSLKQKLSQ